MLLPVCNFSWAICFLSRKSEWNILFCQNFGKTREICFHLLDHSASYSEETLLRTVQLENLKHVPVSCLQVFVKFSHFLQPQRDERRYSLFHSHKIFLLQQNNDQKVPSTQGRHHSFPWRSVSTFIPKWPGQSPEPFLSLHLSMQSTPCSSDCHGICVPVSRHLPSVWQKLL